MMRPGDILGRIFYVVTEINHRNLSTEHTEDTDFFSCLKARNLGGNLFQDVASQEIFGGNL